MKKYFCDRCEKEEEKPVDGAVEVLAGEGTRGVRVEAKVEFFVSENDSRKIELCSSCLWKVINLALNPEEIEKRKEEIEKRKKDEDIPY